MCGPYTPSSADAGILLLAIEAPPRLRPAKVRHAWSGCQICGPHDARCRWNSAKSVTFTVSTCHVGANLSHLPASKLAQYSSHCQTGRDVEYVVPGTPEKCCHASAYTGEYQDDSSLASSARLIVSSSMECFLQLATVHILISRPFDSFHGLTKSCRGLARLKAATRA